MSAHPQPNCGPVGSIRFTQPWCSDEIADEIVTTLIKERDALAARVKAAEQERDDVLQWISSHRPNNEALKARVRELETLGTELADAIEDVQDWSGTRVGDCCDAWRAKETKP